MKELSKKKFNPGFLMSSFVIFFLPVLLFLGYWQITRGYEKQEMWERFTLNKSLPPLAESEILDLNKLISFIIIWIAVAIYLRDLAKDK